MAAREPTGEILPHIGAGRMIEIGHHVSVADVAAALGTIVMVVFAMVSLALSCSSITRTMTRTRRLFEASEEELFRLRRILDEIESGNDTRKSS